MRLFHVTTLDTLPAIRIAGLVPQLGARSRECDEQVPAVFVFVDKESCEAGLTNWLGEAFDETDALIVLELEYTPLRFQQDAAYEMSIFERIPPEAIRRVLDENLKDTTLCDSD
jgi:hypothetical protein